jgi:hypothetical protein
LFSPGAGEVAGSSPASVTISMKKERWAVVQHYLSIASVGATVIAAAASGKRDRCHAAPRHDAEAAIHRASSRVSSLAADVR